LGLSEMVTLQQIEALKSGRIDIGFGRIHIDDTAVVQKVIRLDPLVAVLPAGHHLLGAAVSLEQLAQEAFVLYPGNVRPSYADHVIRLFARNNLTIRVAQMTNELQTAIGLVAAGIGIALVPASVQRLHRDDIGYAPLLDPTATSPIILSYRAGDESVLLQQCLTWIAQVGEETDAAEDSSKTQAGLPSR
jgi:DNA-binding transcriptional LysR family regulator